jgi:hypothetical protein
MLISNVKSEQWRAVGKTIDPPMHTLNARSKCMLGCIFRLHSTLLYLAVGSVFPVGSTHDLPFHENVTDG